METKESKSVGECFELLPGDEQRLTLVAVARVATFAENALWMEWRCADPVTGPEMARRSLEHDRTGKWPKLETWNPKTARNGQSWCQFAGSLCPGLMSYVYDAIANNVAKLYRKKRLPFLRFDDRLPVSDHLRIRFREKAVRILRHPTNPQWFQMQLSLAQSGPVLLNFRTDGKSPHTLAWLDELVETGAFPSGGCISARRKRGRFCWQISLSRVPREGENEKVEPIAGRTLMVWAPLDQSEFLTCQVAPLNGRPWIHTVEGHDLLRLKRRAEDDRRRMGRNYHQSPHSAAHGHGRERAIAGKLGFRDRYQRRVRDWIENRSAEIVRFAVECRCESLQIEKLSDRDPSRLLLGSFDYYRLVSRTVQKARSAGLRTSEFADLEKIKEAFAQAG